MGFMLQNLVVAKAAWCEGIAKKYRRTFFDIMNVLINFLKGFLFISPKLKLLKMLSRRTWTGSLRVYLVRSKTGPLLMCGSTTLYVYREHFATKEDIKRLEDKTATKEQFEAITISMEDGGCEMVQYLLEQRGHKCAAERLRVDSDYEFDIYCNAGVLTAVGEAKVRGGRRDVERRSRGRRSCCADG
jgi:hypothetical protein